MSPLSRNAVKTKSVEMHISVDREEEGFIIVETPLTPLEEAEDMINELYEHLNELWNFIDQVQRVKEQVLGPEE